MQKHIINELKIFAKHLNLLIIDDNEELGKELASIFEPLFKKVSYVNDSESALEKYRKNRYDLVITDLNMPKMDGVELSRHIRTLNKDQVIIVLSGYIDDYVVDLIDIGVQALVIKPYNLENFLQKILQQCENVVLKKAFNKIKLSNETEKDIRLEPKLLVVNSIAQELSKVKKDEIESSTNLEFKKIYDEIDDTMWHHVKEDILELNYEFEDVINSILLRGFNENSKDTLVRIFDKYYSNLLILSNLNELAIIFFELKDLISDIDTDSMQNKNLEILDTLEFFYEDIINFFNIVFIEKETNDINYLTSSLKSSVEQMKCNLGLEDLKEEELEFF